jgi:hypothetical protein
VHHQLHLERLAQQLDTWIGKVEQSTVVVDRIAKEVADKPIGDIAIRMPSFAFAEIHMIGKEMDSHHNQQVEAVVENRSAVAVGTPKGSRIAVVVEDTKTIVDD